jgi:hypothetical protein
LETYLFLVKIKNVFRLRRQTALDVLFQLSELRDEVERGLGGGKPLLEAEQGVWLGIVYGRGDVWHIDDPRADRGGGGGVRFTKIV